jgi:hypothetical protein
MLDGSMLYREFGADCELVVHIEAKCQGHSVLGPKNGFNHPESGALVPMAAALSDLQLIIARQRGFRVWSLASAQFGYIVENVPGPYNPDQHTEDTRMVSAFMDSVFGVPMLHDAALSGDLASRLAKWWTNTFAPEFYAAYEPLFRHKPIRRLADVVWDLTNENLKLQMARRHRQLLGGLNKMHHEAKFLPKFINAPVTANQKMASDGTPGTGMLEVVGSSPPQFVPCPPQLRVAAHQFWPPQMEVIRQEYDDEEVIRVVGNVSAPTYSRVMLRMGISYSVFVC